jgi:hypothetical protein
MAILNNSNAISSGGYDINNSLRFRSSATAYLNRTLGVPTTRNIWTWSGWVKRGALGTQQGIFAAGDGGNNASGLFFNDTNVLGFYDFISASFTTSLLTTQVFRDPSAWYHIVVAYDTTQATSSNRVKIYVNGTQITAFGTATYPSQNYASGQINFNANPVSIGREDGYGNYYDGYLTEINFIDGQALTPSSFGETDTTTGSWKPKAYSGTYGTNGFYLKFSDIATTSGSNAGLGKDFSGNANYWTTNNISVTAGTTYDAMIDSPTLTSATVANYAVLNPLKMPAPASVSYTNGNLSVSCATANQTPALATIYPSSGKWYWEVTWTSGSFARLGVQNTNVASTDFAADTAGWRWESNTGNIYNGSNGTLSTVSTYAANDVLGFCLDLDSGKLYVSKNGTWQNSAVPASGTGAVATNIPTATLMSPAVATGSGTAVFAMNFGQRPFAYTPPSGFLALNTFNLPDSTIKKGNTVMDATLYTGNGGTQTITNAGGFRPDFVWLKRRNTSGNNGLYNSVTGVGNFLVANATDAENSGGGVSSFNSNGWSFGNLFFNDNGDSFVGWQWQAGQGSTSSNTSGSITSTVSVNATAGFSVVTYTSQASGTGTIGHGLGVAPALIINKPRTGSVGWTVYHQSLGNNAYLILNTTAAQVTGATTVWNATSPTSSVFSQGTVFAGLGTMVAYCWAEIAGFSKFGSYTGNGSTDGPFVYTGFRPKFIMRKQTSNNGDVGGWIMFDASRDDYNVATKRLLAHSSNAEATPGNNIDILSNGWKERNSDGYSNASGQTYIYMAFAENPFKNANAR